MSFHKRILCTLKMKGKKLTCSAKRPFLKKIRNFMKIYLSYKDYHIFIFKL